MGSVSEANQQITKSSSEYRWTTLLNKTGSALPKKNENKKLINAWVGAIPVSYEIQEWLQSLIKLTKWVQSAKLISRLLSHRRNIAERPCWTREALPSRKKTKKKNKINAWVGAIPVSGKIQEWLQSLIVRLNWLNWFSQRSISADYLVIVGISLNDLVEQERLCLPFVICSYFLFDTSVFSLALIYFIVPLRDTRSNNTHEQGVKI